MPEVVRLQEKDCAEALAALNAAFSLNENPEIPPHQADFKSILPIMWTEEHDYMSRHLAVKEDGRIAALLGVYPLPSVIAGEKVLLGTIGNVGVVPFARGKGYMKQMMFAAFEEAERLGLVAARLGGLRSRYNRYDFDHAGIIYNCELTKRNVKEYGEVPNLHFVPFAVDNKEGIAFARKCQQRLGIYVVRETELDFYCTMCAWKNIPMLALDENEQYAGYICVSADGDNIAEWGVREGLTAVDLAAAYLKTHTDLRRVVLQVMPFDTENLQAVFAHCESWKEEVPSMFHVFKWDEFVYPLMKLAAQTRGLPDGALTVGIEGWGNLRMTVKDGIPSAEKTEDAAEVTLKPREAVNWFFGDLPAIRPIPGTRHENGWFPLPLSWNEQDRV